MKSGRVFHNLKSNISLGEVRAVMIDDKIQDYTVKNDVSYFIRHFSSFLCEIAYSNMGSFVLDTVVMFQCMCYCGGKFLCFCGGGILCNSK